MKRPVRSRSGFTLAELAIFVLLLSMLFTVMFGSFFGVSRIIKTASPRSRELADATLALEILRSTVGQTYYHPDAERIIFFAHQDRATNTERLTFAAVHPVGGTGSSMVREVSFYLKEMPDRSPTGDKWYYLMKREEEPVDKLPGEGGLHYVILSRVTALKFRYSLNGREWQDKWNTKQSRRIPRLIQIQLSVFVSGKPRTFETLASPGVYLN